MKKPMFKWIYWIHQWSGLILGLFLTVLGLTGAFLALLPQLEAFENPAMMVVRPSKGWVPPSKAVEEVAREYPRFRLLLLLLPTEPTIPYKMFLTNPENKLFRITVSEYSGKILGMLPDSRRFSGWVGDLHAHLFLGLWGSVVGACLSVLLVLSIVTGFYVHLVMRRAMFEKGRKNKSLRLLFSDWHRVVSLASLALNLVLAITGAFLGFERLPIAASQKKAPPLKESEFHMVLPALPIDTYLNKTRLVFPEKEPEIVSFSPSSGGPVAVLTREPYRKFFRTYSQVTMDSKTGAVLSRFDALNSGYKPKLHGVMLALHIGDFGGVGVRIIYCIVGLTPGFLSITGFVMWLKRKRLFARKVDNRASDKPALEGQLTAAT